MSCFLCLLAWLTVFQNRRVSTEVVCTAASGPLFRFCLGYRPLLWVALQRVSGDQWPRLTTRYKPSFGQGTGRWSASVLTYRCVHFASSGSTLTSARDHLRVGTVIVTSHLSVSIRVCFGVRLLFTKSSMRSPGRRSVMSYSISAIEQ